MGRNISIHALLAESDDDLLPSTTRRLTFLSTLSLRRATLLLHQYVHNTHISIHALLAESDHAQDILTALNNIFLSTLSLRRATPRPCTLGWFQYHFYPRSPCGERQPTTRRNNKHNMISIHALLAESDYSIIVNLGRTATFLSTLSLRRATRNSQNIERRHKISIHALLAESDHRTQTQKHLT